MTAVAPPTANSQPKEPLFYFRSTPSPPRPIGIRVKKTHFAAAQKDGTVRCFARLYIKVEALRENGRFCLTIHCPLFRISPRQRPIQRHQIHQQSFPRRQLRGGEARPRKEGVIKCPTIAVRQLEAHFWPFLFD